MSDIRFFDFRRSTRPKIRSLTFARANHFAPIRSIHLGIECSKCFRERGVEKKISDGESSFSALIRTKFARENSSKILRAALSRRNNRIVKNPYGIYVFARP
jgi:hypothetical protein